MRLGERRLDRLGFGQIPLGWVMGIPEIALPFILTGPPFPVPRADALAKVRAWLASAGERRARAYLSKDIVRPEQLILQLGSLAPGEGPDRRGSWVAFIDLVPDQNWAHRCCYLFVDPDGALRVAQAEWYPLGLHDMFAPVQA